MASERVHTIAYDYSAVLVALREHGGPRTAKELAQLTGYSANYIRLLLGAALAEEAVRVSARRLRGTTFWDLPHGE